MGMSKKVYLGAYAVCKVKPVREPTTELACAEHGPFKYQDSIYCPKCGKQLEIRQTGTRFVRPMIDDFLPEDMADALYAPVVDEKTGTLFLISNAQVPLRVCVEVDLLDEGKASVIAPDDVTQMVENFKEAYKNVLAVLEIRTQSVEVVWGMVTWWN